MWPKMLIELLPHLSRLVPMWDKFLSSKAANDKATEATIEAMSNASAGVQQSLGEMAAAHTSLYRQIQEQGAETTAQIAALEQEVQFARIVTERLDAAVRQAEVRVAALTTWLKGGLLVLGALILIVLVLVADLLRRG